MPITTLWSFVKSSFCRNMYSWKKVGIMNLPRRHVGESHSQDFMYMWIFWFVVNSLNHCLRYLTDWSFVCDIRGPGNCQSIIITAKLSLWYCTTIYKNSHRDHRLKVRKKWLADSKTWLQLCELPVQNIFLQTDRPGLLIIKEKGNGLILRDFLTVSESDEVNGL